MHVRELGARSWYISVRSRLASCAGGRRSWAIAVTERRARYAGNVEAEYRLAGREVRGPPSCRRGRRRHALCGCERRGARRCALSPALMSRRPPDVAGRIVLRRGRMCVVSLTTFGSHRDEFPLAPTLRRDRTARSFNHATAFPVRSPFSVFGGGTKFALSRNASSTDLRDSSGIMRATYDVVKNYAHATSSGT